MRTEDFEHLAALEGDLWCFRGMRAVTAAHLDAVLGNGRPRAMLDVGCGTGFMLGWLKRYSGGQPVFGVDPNEAAFSWCRQHGHRRVARGSILALPFPTASVFDLVTCFDVLACLSPDEDDSQALWELYRVLKPGGWLYLRVAAYPWLWSDHDRVSGSRHRYTLPEVRRKVAAAGFRVGLLTYVNTLLFPVAVVHRLLQRVGISRGTDVRPLPRGWRWVNPYLARLLHWEGVYTASDGRRLPCGLSVVCAAQRE